MTVDVGGLGPRPDDDADDDSIERNRWDRPLAVIRRRLPAVQFVLDALAWAIAIPLATLVRYDFGVDRVDWPGQLRAIIAAVVAQAGIGAVLGLYRRQYHYGSLDEVRVLGLTVGAVALLGLGLARQFPGTVPRSVPLAAGALMLVMAMCVRYVARLVEDRALRPHHESEPIVVFGVGNAGRQAVRTLLRTPDSPFRPVALLDDDVQKSRLRIDGLRVQGTRADVAEITRAYGVRRVLIAIPSADGDLLRELSSPMEQLGLEVLVLPPAAQLFGVVQVSDIRPLTIADLLGRAPAQIDTAAIADYVRGRNVLVTGAGGSIGSELCRQLSRYSPAALVMLDRDESGLHGTQLSIEGRAMLDSPLLALADIRDRDRVFELFGHHRPDVVFHAAALKHQPLLELHPSEAWKTNVEGTRHVLDAAVAVGVDHFVNISTDKAANAEGVLGYSKRLCERLTAETAIRTGVRFVSVRFGNVLGSKGSMLGTFERQVAAGGPITVTHPDVSRYFMTVEEAVALTIQAGAIGRPGEALVLDMGAPVRILDVARRLAERADPPVDITFTGLRPGEKLHEVLLNDDEADVRPTHPLISEVPVPPISFEQARDLVVGDGSVPVQIEALRAATYWSDAGADQSVAATQRRT